MLPPSRLLLVLLMVSGLLFSQNQSQAGSSTRKPIDGSRIFRQHCASCHGADGRGHGPAAAALKDDVPDLTRISQRHGGKFPREQVKKVIEGKDASRSAHGTCAMPVWGPVFHDVEWDLDLGYVRLEAVTTHIESIQRK